MEKLDSATSEKLDRGRKQRDKYVSTWAICDAYYHGRQNVVRSVSDPNKIVELARRRQTATGELQYRRITNRILPVVSTLVAKYASRVPGYSVQPDSGDPIAINNARSSEHALRSEYTRLNMARKVPDLLTLAANQGDGFANVYWDPSAGAEIVDGVFEGNIVFDILPTQCVIWEGGLRYEESPWFGWERAIPASEATRKYGIKDPDKDAISQGSLIDNVLGAAEGEKGNMVTVTHYLERPTKDNPKGRRLVLIGERIVKDEPYTYSADKFAETQDDNWLVRFSYFNSPSRDRNMGVTEQLIDVQNAWNVTENQIAKVKDLRTNRPMICLKGSYNGPANLVPGGKYEYNEPDGKPEFLDVPEVGQDTFNYLDLLRSNFEDLSGQHAVSRGESPTGVDTASGLQSLIQQDDSQRAAILHGIADAHAKVGLRILLLLRAYASESRLMQYTGKSGHEGVMMFRGGEQVPKKNLCVRVSPGSIEPRTRDQIQTLVMAYADRGWIDPRVAMSAVEAGTAENVLDQFDLDVQWQQREDRRMAALAEGDLQALAAALDKEAEIKAEYVKAKTIAEQVGELPPPPPPPAGPWPHARDFDNHQVHMDTMNLYRKTEEFDLLPEEVKGAFQSHYEEHESFKAQADQRAFEAQQAQAIEQGQANAAKPTRVRGVPSAPAPAINKQG